MVKYVFVGKNERPVLFMSLSLLCCAGYYGDVFTELMFERKEKTQMGLCDRMATNLFCIVELTVC